jgi:hypothetical protein
MTAIQEYPEPFYPGSVMDYGRNWGISSKGTPGFLQEDEIITASNWIITSSMEDVITLVPDAQGSGISVDKQITSIFLTGGTAGVKYELQNAIETLTKEGNVRKESRIGLIRCCAKK